MSQATMNVEALTEKATAVEAARQEYLCAKSEEEIARRNSTECLNRLNKAQKEFEAVYQELLIAAPKESDWNLIARDRRLLGPLDYVSERG